MGYVFLHFPSTCFCDIPITYHVVALSANGCSLGDSWQEPDEWPEDRVSPELNKSNMWQSAGTVDM